LHEGVLDFFAAVNWGDEDEESAAGDEETERAGGGVAFFVWWVLVLVQNKIKSRKTYRE
jgi:hypothetical protein